MKNEYSSGILVYRYFSSEEKFLFLVTDSGRLDFPKGHIEKGESEISAAFRETKEECNTVPNLVPFFKEKTSYFFYANGGKIHKYLTMFLGESKNDTIKVSHEHKSYVWLSPKEALDKLNYKSAKELVTQAHEYLQRLKGMKRINSEYASLPSKSRTWDLSRTYVPGEGPLNAKAVLLGQAPGQKENIERRPFVGRSGMLLSKVLKNAKLKRDELYILSTVQFFPPKNRIPTDKEIELCKPFLIRQLELIKPKYVVLMGLVATKTMLNMGAIAPNHSKLFGKDGRKYFVTFHPAAALRFHSIEVLMQHDFENFNRLLSKKR